MYRHHRLRIEQDLATARRAMYRALRVAEEAQEFGLQEDLILLNAELERVFKSVLPRPHTVRNTRS